MVLTVSADLPDIPGYTLREKLYTGTKTVVYRAISVEQQMPVVIKVLRLAYPSFNELVQFRNQYTIAKDLAIPGIVRPLGLEPWQNAYALVMEDTGDSSLKAYVQAHALSLQEILAIALQMADILHHLCQHRVVHKDIKPANILIHPDSKRVKLIDFSIASLLPKETQDVQNPSELEGTLAYLAPEQTGRMNRGIDYRADFYGLGVTLYELLTGELPFQSDDLLELVHCHMAKAPVPPHEVLRRGDRVETACPPSSTSPSFPVPKMLSAIVLKLMAKNAEDRYQSALGLKHDLTQCMTQWKETGTITAFELGQHDRCDRFLIPEKLYGREAQVQALLDAFARVTNGSSEMMLVAGCSGIGKTAVVNEVHKPITRQHGYFIKGKFDQFNRNLPLSGFVQALRDLMRQVLSEPDTQLTQWRAQLLDALGTNGQVLIEIIPELECVIGPQPPAPELSGTAVQNRFNVLFQKFIEVFTTAKHPLVIFLDDLQWADSASLQLIRVLMRDQGHLLWLGAYRDNEVLPTHPFMQMVEDLKKTTVIVNTTTLSPLDFEDTNQLVADTLRCSTARSHPLATLIERKTQGNPFFTAQFLKALYEDGQITFNSDRHEWECDITQVNQLSLTDDVVEFMAQQLQKLPRETQQVLRLAACIGNQFNLSTLAIVSQQSQSDVANALWKGLQEGLITPHREAYKFYLGDEPQAARIETSKNVVYQFLHDRVQQAAYALIPDDQKQTTHYQIGQLLRARISAEEREERIFELINQLNYGNALIAEQAERDELAQLNLVACRKARAANAYQSSREYVSAGLSLLGRNAWHRQYEMSLAFHNLAAELAALCGDFEMMEQFVETVITEAKSLPEKVNVYRISIQANVSQNQLFSAITLGQRFLQALEITFPQLPTPNDIQQSIAEIDQLIGDRKIEALIHLPMMTDRATIAIVQIANSIIPATYLIGSPLLPLVVSLSTKLSIQHGNIPDSAFAYACCGVITCNVSRDIDAGHKFGQLALQLVSKLDAKAVKPKVFDAVSFFILHRKAHIRETLPLLREGYIASLEVGNLEVVGYLAQQICLHSVWCSRSLVTLVQESSAYYNRLIQLNQAISANWCRIHWQAILNLLGEAEYPSILSGEALQETDCLSRLRSNHDSFGVYIFYLYKLMFCYLFDEIESAQEYATEIEKYCVAGSGTVGEPAFYFYDALITLATLSTQSKHKSEAWERIEQNQTQLQHDWAHYAPMNHQHKVDLVEAEKYRVLDQKVDAIEHYDKAIAGAKANEYTQEEALANELAAKFYLDWGKERVAAGYMQEAYYCYARWGSKAKTDHLEKRYPNLLRPILQQPIQTLNPLETLASMAVPHLSSHPSITNSHTNSHASSRSINAALDFSAVLKASQVLSGTIQLDALLRQLTQIILQNSGGDCCTLILPNHNGVWFVKAIATSDTTDLCSEPLEDNLNLPVKLLQYVKNTQEVVMIDNLQTDLPVIDAYLSQQRPKSLLCLPILNQGRLIGMVYLKSQSARDVFTSDRVLILNFLCTQAAISLENARLYRAHLRSLDIGCKSLEH